MASRPTASRPGRAAAQPALDTLGRPVSPSCDTSFCCSIQHEKALSVCQRLKTAPPRSGTGSRPASVSSGPSSRRQPPTRPRSSATSGSISSSSTKSTRPFDRVAIDVVLLAARATGTAGIVRVAEPTPSRILSGPRRGGERRARSPRRFREEGRGSRRRLPLSRRQEWASPTPRGRAIWRAIRLAARRRRRRRGDRHRHDRRSGGARRDRGHRPSTASMDSSSAAAT